MNKLHLTLELTEDVRRRLDQIGDAMGGAQPVDVIRQALVIFDVLEGMTRQGQPLTIVSGNDDIGRVMEHVVLTRAKLLGRDR